MSASSSSSSPSFTMLYFASASSFTGMTRETLPAPLALADLFPSLETRYPGFRAAVLETCLVTINLEYVDVPETNEGSRRTVAEEGTPPRETEAGEGERGLEDISVIIIHSGDEVAIIPPVSSG